MDGIFSEARQVLVWLGPSEQNSTLAIQTLGKIAAGLNPLGNRDGEYNFIARPGSWTEHLDNAMVPGADACIVIANTASWFAIRDLVCRPWFTRLWVYQEVILARTAVAIVGEATCRLISQKGYFLYI